MTKAEELQKQLDDLRDAYKESYQSLADELLLVQYGAEVGATLINDDEEEFLIQEIRYSDANARARKLTGIKSVRAHIEIEPHTNVLGWRKKDEN